MNHERLWNTLKRMASKKPLLQELIYEEQTLRELMDSLEIAEREVHFPIQQKKMRDATQFIKSTDLV